MVHPKYGVATLLGLLIASSVGAQQSEFVPVTDEMLQNPDPADWPMWRRTLNHWGHSPLDQIDRGNVSRLRLVWTRPLNPGVQEGTPLVYDGTMYFPHPNDFTQAIDATTGDLIWEYRRPVQDDNNDYVLFPSINRNLAIYGNYILDNGADNYAYALDARTGELAWETQILDYRLGGQHSGGPIVANGKVVSGRSCAPKGGPEACVITAFDALTGEELWRTHTIPRPGEPGDETWGDIPYEERRHVGTWMIPSFDPELNRIYIGTSVTSPAPKFMLAGNDEQYLYHNSTLSLDADTGEIVWYMQHVVDHWDLDHPFERLLIDTAIAPDPDAVEWINPRVRPGEVRKVVTGVPGKTGLVYTVDRDTGQFLWARETIMQNVISEVNTESGAGIVNPDMLYTGVGQEKLVCPSLNGGKNYHASAYSPLSGIMYIPLHNTCMSATSNSEVWQPDDAYAIDTRLQLPPGVENAGSIEAISATTGETVWKREQRAVTTSLMTTGSGLLFGGDANGRFRAYDQLTGEILWEVNLGSHVTGYPATFAVGGRQYVAVSTGGSLNTLSLMALAPELRSGTANNLYVFALPD
ncbi:pyrroloquinoline quinone-dependent dehydrogenase [Candidatus Rariloculus sp.]|uniref:pyrroloquinoline quinone-dependent dehydrogenase n=1 Tax=Candidatus Rariloculus sp. TaxID=3101265 RepID=UPI003D0FAFB3